METITGRLYRQKNSGFSGAESTEIERERQERTLQKFERENRRMKGENCQFKEENKKLKEGGPTTQAKS